jgi:hypothetical protein
MASTTTKLGDFLGRSLVNDNPGTSTATDFLGRSATGTDKDFLGRSLVNTPLYPPPDRANSTAYTAGQRVKQKGTDEVQTITVTATANNYKLNVDNRGEVKTTANIPYNSNGTAITSAINALPNVKVGDIVVTGASSPYTVTVQSERGNVTQLAVVAGSPDVTGGTVTTGTTTQGGSAGEILEATTSGTTAGSVPTTPAVGATVVDGGVTWRRLK